MGGGAENYDRCSIGLGVGKLTALCHFYALGAGSLKFVIIGAFKSALVG